MLTLLREAFSVTRLSFWIGMALSSLIGISLYLFTHNSIENEAQQRFMNHARYAQSVISVRVKSYTDLLRASASLVQSSEKFTHRQFHEFVQGLHIARNYPAVDYINFAVFFQQDQRGAFVSNLRAEKRFLGERAAQLDIHPRGIRPAYLAVGYIEPEALRPELYGYDLMTNRYFFDLLRRERDEGTIQTAGTPIGPLSAPNDTYLGMRMPVYRLGARTDNVEQRRAAYTGSIGIAFSVPKLLKGVIEKIPVAGVRMTLQDTSFRMDSRGRGVSGVPFTLFDSLGTSKAPNPPLAAGDEVFTTTLPLDFNGRAWHTVYSAPKAALYTETDQFYPKMVMAFGFFGSIMLYALMFVLTTSRRAALILAQEMTSELRESQNKLQLSHQKLRRLADHAYQIREMERKRIAREIHDDLGQNLLALRIEAEMLTTRSSGTHGHLHKRARATLLQIDATIKSVRQIINDLRPTVLDLGLSAAVEWQVSQFQRRTGIQCEIHDDHGEISIPDHCATAFFRILQESLTNIVRHARASKVVVELRLYGGWLSMTVRDNGCGLPPEGRDKHGSFGLVGIEERIVILGGTCAVFSEQEGGTTIMVSAPVIGMPEVSMQLEQEHEPGSAVI